MKPDAAAKKLQALHKALTVGRYSTEHIADPIAKRAMAAAKQAAAGRPTPQAPALASAWYERIEGNVARIGTGDVLSFSHGAVSTDRMQSGILFGSNRHKQFRRAHSVPSWAWRAMEPETKAPNAEKTLQDVLDDVVGNNA